MVLDLPGLECARFEILRRLDNEAAPYALTVFTRTKEQTSVLQTHARSGKVVFAVVRVVVARRAKDDAATLLVTDLDEDPRIKRLEIKRPAFLDGIRWSGFEMIASRPRILDEKLDDPMRKPQPWCLVIEEIIQPPTKYLESPTEIGSDADSDPSAIDDSPTD
jgi:hypothetical protein